MPEAVRVTTVGFYHLHRLVRTFSYVDAVVVDTPILDDTYTKDIKDVHAILERLERAKVFRSYLDSCWHECREMTEYFDWSAASKQLGDQIVAIRHRVVK